MDLNQDLELTPADFLKFIGWFVYLYIELIDTFDRILEGTVQLEHNFLDKTT